MSAGETDVSSFTEALLTGPPSEAVLTDLCESATRRRVAGVCVPVGAVLRCRDLLEESDIKVVAYLVANHPDVRRYETEVAIDDGAHEIVTTFDTRPENRSQSIRELRDIVEAADERPVQAHLNLQAEEEILSVCESILESGIRFISLGHVAPSPDLIQKVRKVIGPTWGLKVSIGAFQQNLHEPPADASPLDQAYYKAEQIAVKRSIGDKRALISAGATRLSASYFAR